jgi:hypothetical protein
MWLILIWARAKFENPTEGHQLETRDKGPDTTLWSSQSDKPLAS